MGFMTILFLGAGLYLLYRWARAMSGRGHASSGDITGGSDSSYTGYRSDDSAGRDTDPRDNTSTDCGFSGDSGGDSGGCDGGGGGD